MKLKALFLALLVGAAVSVAPQSAFAEDVEYEENADGSYTIYGDVQSGDVIIGENGEEIVVD